MLTTEEKIQELLTDPLIKDCRYFYLVVLDKSKPAFFVNAFKVDTTAHVTVPLKNNIEFQHDGSNLRPSVHICDNDKISTTNILSWNLNRGKKKEKSQQNIVIRQKKLPDGPVFFYNIGESEIIIRYRHDERIKDFQPFTVAPGEAITDRLNPPILYNPVKVLKDEYHTIKRNASTK